jgi:xanthine dehydrogenase/oxidase
MQVQQINLYNENETTHYGQPIINCNLAKCWTEVIRKSDYEARRKEIEDFNAKNRWKKRGIAVVPVKFGIAFTATFLNQVMWLAVCATYYYC